MNINSQLIEEYKNCIRRAQTFEPIEKGYLEAYKEADSLERKIKTDIVKILYKNVEDYLDNIDNAIRSEKKTDS